MPALPTVPNCLRADLYHTVASDSSVLMRLHLSYSGGPPAAADCATLATAIRTAYGAHMAGQLGTSNDLVQTVVTDLASLSGHTGEDTTAVAGTRGVPQTVNGACTLINMKIARRYRGGKPRIYGPYGIASDLTNHVAWSTAFTGGLLTAWEAFIAAVVGQVAGTTTITGHVNVSYFAGFTVVTNPVTGRTRNVSKLRVGGPVVDPILGYAIPARVASQRRRNN